MKHIRKPNENLEELLRELKIGDNSIYDSETNYEITKVPSGFVYKHEYVGLVFVPDFPDSPTAPACPPDRPKTQPPKIEGTMAEKKVEKPAKKVVTK